MNDLQASRDPFIGLEVFIQAGPLKGHSGVVKGSRGDDGKEVIHVQTTTQVQSTTVSIPIAHLCEKKLVQLYYYYIVLAKCHIVISLAPTCRCRRHGGFPDDC